MPPSEVRIVNADNLPDDFEAVNSKMSPHRAWRGRLSDLERAFLALNVEIQDAFHTPIHECYTQALTFFPACRDAHIYGNFDDAYRAVLAKPTSDTVMGAYYWAVLQAHFFGTLRDNNFGFEHVARYQMLATTVWARRFRDLSKATYVTHISKKGLPIPETINLDELSYLRGLWSN
jgi:hypothetical protein